MGQPPEVRRPPPGGNPLSVRTTASDEDPIFVLEDDDDLRLEIEEVLRDHGYNVAAFEHGEAAWRDLESGTSPRLVLLDLMMPVMDGWRFFARMKSRPALASVPIVIFTHGRNLANAPVSAAYLEKPVRREDLLAALDRVLRSS
jgi:CheY-like chemotaxis protein